MGTNQRHHIAIVGLGYVGLPLAYAFVQAGNHVLGLDINEKHLGMLRNGTSMYGVPDLTDAIENGNLTLTANASGLRQADCIIICVPTPLDQNGQPDLSILNGACQTVAENFRRGATIVLESTTYPTYTDTFLLPLLTDYHPDWQVGVDFFLAFSPERVNPNEDGFDVRSIPKVLGGMTPACYAAAHRFYGSTIQSIVSVSSPRAAEMTKLLENAYRLVNVSLANEIAAICRAIGVDPHEVIQAAATKPYGFVAFRPSLGAGGHCIPVDPVYLADYARDIPASTRLLDAAISVNYNMPIYWTERITSRLAERGIDPHDANVLILGVTYKPDVPDIRESMSVYLARRLHLLGITVAFHDPYFASVTLNGTTLQRVPHLDTAVASADLVVIGTPHRQYMTLQLWTAAEVVDPSGSIRLAGQHQRSERAAV